MLDEGDGEIKWSYKTDGPISSSPAVVSPTA
ncbi:PQQ-binding-like beta-propeller repeat protein [Chloroflexota bacterium]